MPEGVTVEERLAAVEEVLGEVLQLLADSGKAPRGVLEAGHQDLVKRVRERRARTGGEA